MITVYTAVFGGYDHYLTDVKKYGNVRNVAFTDRDENETSWECIQPSVEYGGRKENRKYKIRSHQWFPQSEWTIYLDGNLRLKETPSNIIQKCKQISNTSSIFLFQHNMRDCIYREASSCAYNRLDKPTVIRRQINRYKKEKYPKNNGLYWGGFLVRRAGCEAFNDCWWSEVDSNSIRDQISLPYALYKTQVDFSVIHGGIPFYGGTNPYVDRISHLRR